MSDKNAAVHENHRARMHERFEKSGFDHFADHEVLEYLLFYSIPRRDVNPLAHRLLNHFGSLSAVLKATRDELMQVDGVGEKTARMIVMIMETGRRFQKDNVSKPKAFKSLDEIGEYIKPHFYASRKELVFALFLDDRNMPIRLEKLAEGSVNEAPVSKKELVRQAVRLDATQVVLAHNHPKGIALPSTEDLVFTKELAVMLKNVGITLLDHVIVDGEGDMTSMRQSNRAHFLG